jgi:RNA polymerase sigma factor (sigma-70 family)
LNPDKPVSQQFIVAYIPALRRYARVLTGDAWAADDLVQDTLERACSKWRLWLAGTDLRAWLFTVMHNIFIDQVRQSQRRSDMVDLDAVEHTLQAPNSTQILAIDLQRCLLRLPAEQRAVLLLVVLEEMSYAEVAKVAGVPIGTVMSRLSRARERLRELMSESKEPNGRSTPLLRVMK